MKKTIFAILMAAPLLASASTNYRELLMKAMHSPDGTAKAELSGGSADLIRSKINRPNAKILAEVTTVEKLKLEGCKRLQVRYTTPGTLLPTKDGGARMLDVSFKLNMCENGQPPGDDPAIQTSELSSTDNQESQVSKEPGKPPKSIP